MKRLVPWATWAVIAVSVTLGAAPLSAPAQGSKEGPPSPQPSSAAASFSLPLSQAEKQLAAHPQALASSRHAKAVALLRDYLKSGDITKLYIALNTAGEAVGLDPGRARYWITLGTIHSELSRFNILRSNEYAQDSFRQALELVPDDAATRVLLAVNLAKGGEYEEALDHFEAAVKKDILVLNPDIARWMNACYLADAHTKRGALFYDAVQKAHPGYYYLSLHKAVLYRAHFDHASARRELANLLKQTTIDGETKRAARQLLGEMDKGKGGRS